MSEPERCTCGCFRETHTARNLVSDEVCEYSRDSADPCGCVGFQSEAVRIAGILDSQPSVLSLGEDVETVDPYDRQDDPRRR